MKSFKLLMLGFFLCLIGLQVKAAAIIIDPNNGTASVHVAYSQSTAGLQLSYTAAGNGTFTLTMPAGVTYIPGSMTFTSSAGAVIAESNVSNLAAPVFSITGATVGANSVITYGIRANCATQGSASIGVSVTVGDTDTGSISISILKAALTIDAHDAAVSYSRGGSGSSTIQLTNGGNGSLDSLVFFFKQNGPLVTDSIKANGFLATYIGTTGDTLFYQMRGVHFPGGTLDNGESIIITRYFHVPVCSATGFPNFQSTYLANFGRNGARCQSPTPGDYGQYNYNSSSDGNPTVSVAQVAVERQASPCQTALVRYRMTNTGTGNLNFAKLFDAWLPIGGTPSNGYLMKAVTLVSNGATLPVSGGNINVTNSAAVQGVNPDAIGTGLEDLDGDGYFDDLNPGQSFEIRIEWEYRKATACSNDPGNHNVVLRGFGLNMCGTAIGSGNLTIISGRMHAIGLLLLNSSPPELGTGQVGTIQTQVSRTAPNLTYLSCPTNQWSVRFPLAPGMVVSAMRIGSTNLSFSVVADTATAVIVNTTSNPFFLDVDFTITPGVTPNGTSPTVILSYMCNSTCGPNSREDVACLGGPGISIPVPAPGDCVEGGGLTGNSQIQRITTGFTDYTGTAHVPLSSLTNLSKKRGLPCDSVLVTSTGGVQAGTIITGGEPLYYEISYNLHGGSNRLFQWFGGTYTYQSTTAPLPAPTYEANYNGKHYVIYSLGLYPVGAVVDVSVYGIELNAATLTNTLEGVSGFSNNFFNLDDGFSNPSPNMGDTRYSCNGRALEFYVRNPRGGFETTVYSSGGVCNQWSEVVRFWYLRSEANSGIEIDYFPGEVRPIEVLDSIVANIPVGYTYVPGGDLLEVGGNPNDGGFPASPFRSLSITPSAINGQRVVWRNPGNWIIPDDAARGGYRVRFNVKSDCTVTGYTCGSSVPRGNMGVQYFAKTNVNSRNPSCPIAVTRTPGGYNTFGGRPVHTITNLSGTQNADQRVECFNIKLNVSCATSFNTYIYFPGGGPTGTFNITSVKNTTTNAVYPVLQAAGGQWAQLGNVGGDLFLTVCSEYSNCANPDIPYRISWGCSSYPADPATSGCSTLSGSFDLSPAPSGLQAQFIAQPTNPVSLCDPLVYDFNMLSTLAADLVDPRLEVTIPTGMSINTVQIEYPYNSGNFETVTPSGTTGTVTIPYGLHSMVNDSLPGVNFQTMPNPRTARMRLSFLTDCNFTSGNRIQIKAKGEEPCGAPAQGNNTLVYSDPIQVAGVSQDYLTLVSNLNIGPDTIITCENRTISLDMVLINSGTSPVMLDPALDSCKIDFPAGIRYVAGSYSCSSGSNCFLPPIVDGSTLNLSLPVPAGITIPASGSITISFSLQINALIDEGCNVPGGLTFSMVRSFAGVSCSSAPGGVCPNPVRFITGSSTVQISPKKANISSITASVCRTSTDNYSFNGTFAINQGAVPAMQSVVVEVYCLSGGNPVGAPVATQTVNGLLNMSSGNIPFSGSFMTTCAGEQFQVRLSPVTNGGTDQCVCSAVSTNVGLINPTFSVTAGSTCAGSLMVNLPLTSITNGGNQYTVDFDDPLINDVTSATAIPSGGILNLSIPSSLATGTYTGTVTVINSSTGCSGTAPLSFVIHALPTVTPTAEVCIGGTVMLSGSGTPATNNPFVSSNTSRATVTSAGVVSGLSAGTVNITYTDNNGCSAVSAVTVNALPTLNGGSVCAGSTITLTGSGTPAAVDPYLSSNIAVATVTSAGVVTGVSAGMATITYTDDKGCSTTAMVTVNPLPTMSGGSVCVGSTITVLGSGIPALIPYMSSNTAVATVNNGGLVTGMSAGTAMITYTDLNGCQVIANVVVSSLPTLSGGAVCVGNTITLTGSGTAAALDPYTSSNPAVATVTSGGVVTGVSAGSAVITYTDNNGCQATATVTVSDMTSVSFANVSSCNYNATSSAGDDYFTADIIVTFNGAPSSGTLDLTGDVLTGGGALSAPVAMVGSGPTYTFVGVRLKADGTASEVTAAFSAVGGCSLTNSNGPNVSACSPVASLGDPCSCHDVVYDQNESLELLDYIEVTAPVGETWNVISHTGLEEINALTNIPLVVPAPLTYDAMSGKYRIHISHDNAIGYTATLSNGTVTLMISNVCNQHDPVDLVLPAAICASAAATALPATQPNFNTEYRIGSLSGTVVTSFDPALYTPGTTVELYALHSPILGTDCPKKVKYQIQINALPTLSGGGVCVGNTITLTGSGTPAAVNPYVSSNTAVATVTSAGVVTGVSAGSAVITYTDNNGCQVMATVTVSAKPVVTIAQTAPSCSGSSPLNNGKLTITAASNVTNWGISTLNAAMYDGPAYPATTFTSIPLDVISGVPNSGGTYILRLFNSSGCFKDTTITVAAVSCITATLTYVQSCSCFDVEYNLPDTDPLEFTDSIKVTSNPGENWHFVSHSGLEVPDSFVNIPLAQNAALFEYMPGMYGIRFSHTSGVGYTGSITNGQQVITLSNLCTNPSLTIPNLAGAQLCPTTPPVDLTTAVATLNGVQEPGTFTFDIVRAPGDTLHNVTTFDPALMPNGSTVKVIGRYVPTNTMLCPHTFTYPVQVSSANCPCALQIVSAVAGNCDPLAGATYALTVNVSWENAPVGEAIQVTTSAGGTGTYTPSNASGSHAIVITGLTANGMQDIDISAQFATTTTCNAMLADAYDAPQSCMPMPCTGGSGTIGGRVYEDLNNNGAYNGEPGVGSVIVNVYNAAGVQVFTTISGNDGQWSATGLTDGVRYRVEFIIPQTLGYLEPSVFGTENGSTVQFVTPAGCDTDLGLINPGDFCQNNPLVVLPCYFSGPQDNNEPATVGIYYNTPDSNTPAEYGLVNDVQIGTTYGTAWQRHQKMLYASAVVRHFFDYGPGGFDAIYAISVNDPNGSAAPNPSSSVAHTIHLGTLGVNMGTNPRTTPLSGNPPYNDGNVYQSVGKIGIGDIDISDDGDTLFVVNLNAAAPSLVRLNVSNPAAVTLIAETPIPNPGCSGGAFAPWGVKYYKGKIYIGGVCTAESSQNLADLTATVYRWDGGSTFTTVASMPLNYDRAAATFRSNDTYSNADWRPWTNTWAPNILPLSPNDLVSQPMPILQDIEFDDDGSMILGFGDRFSYQTAYGNRRPGVTTGPTFSPVASGDIIRFCNVGGSLVREGTSGSCTQSNNDRGALEIPAIPNNIFEYYNDDYLNANTTQAGHSETMLGGLAKVRGRGEILAVGFDPRWNQGPFNTSGVRFLNSNGTAGKGWVVVPESANGANRKGGNLGDIETLCDPVKMEIGNYVWVDTNKDGIQDPNEAPLANITVTLWKNGTQIASVVTNANGEYYFSSKSRHAVPASWTGTGADTTLRANMAYEVRIDLAQTGITTPNYQLTLQNATSGAGSDLNDSDAVIAGNSAVIALITAGDGFVDHTYDFGFWPCYTLTNPSAGQSVCVGVAGTNLTVNTTFNAANGIRFVRFGSDQSATNGAESPAERANIYSAGTVMATVTATGTMAPYTATYLWSNADFPTPGTYYVYAILNPDQGADCRPVQEYIIIVKPLPTLSGGTVCEGSTITLTGSGTPAAMNPYVSSNTAVATVTSAGVVTGVSAGSVTITYTDNNGCQATATVTVNAAPSLNGSTTSVCAGSAITLTGSGVPAAVDPYVSSNTAMATVTSAGVVTGIMPGMVNITYTDNNGCSTTVGVTVQNCCTAPTASLISVPGDCNASLMPNNNGRIVLMSQSGADKIGFSVGASYSGPAYAAATAVPTTPGDLVSNIPNTPSATYTIRVFGGSNFCFTDYTITVDAGATCPTDPMGYIYCEANGQIIAGGSITVNGPGTVLITKNGSTGEYQFFTDGTAGTYTMTYTPPAGYALSTIHLPLASIDPTGQPNPYQVGAGSSNGVSLDNFTPAANPYTFSFVLAPGDPEIQLNNIPLSGCCIAPILTVVNGSVCRGGSINLATLVTSSGGGTLSYYNTLSDAQNGVNAIASGTATVNAAQHFYIRSQTAPGCFTVKQVTVTLKPDSCGTINVNGPN